MLRRLSLFVALCTLAAIPPGAAAVAVQPAAPLEAGACAVPGVGLTADCTCDAEIFSSEPNVWGIGPYTDDSDVCSAALHAGVAARVTRGQSDYIVGSFVIAGGAGCEAYPAGSANGVTTTAYPSWPGSFYFPATQSGSCVTGEAAEMPPTDIACPRLLPDGVKQLLCYCTPEEIALPLDIWGTQVYTADSPICRAALHAGAVGAGGGAVNVTRFGTTNYFAGTAQNGVQSLTWEMPWPAAFGFF